MLRTENQISSFKISILLPFGLCCTKWAHHLSHPSSAPMCGQITCLWALYLFCVQIITGKELMYSACIVTVMPYKLSVFLRLWSSVMWCCVVIGTITVKAPAASTFHCVMSCRQVWNWDCGHTRGSEEDCYW